MKSLYKKGYGIIKTLAPLHVGATAGEETGNLNLIFRDQFTQTGIIPGSSIRGRLRAEMRLIERQKQSIQDSLKKEEETSPEKTASAENENDKRINSEENYWYGSGSEKNRQQNYQYESIIKIEQASIIWLPVFCPGQPIVWISCQQLLERYKRIVGIKNTIPKVYTRSSGFSQDSLPIKNKKGKEVLFFNLGFLPIEPPKQEQPSWSCWFPDGQERPAVIVDDKDMGMIHDMALYRQSRVALEENQKVVANKAFFNVEALPEGTILIFPVAMKPNQKGWDDWKPFADGKEGDIYLGGLESVGFGHCHLTIKEVIEEDKEAEKK